MRAHEHALKCRTACARHEYSIIKHALLVKSQSHCFQSAETELQTSTCRASLKLLGPCMCSTREGSSSLPSRISFTSGKIVLPQHVGMQIGWARIVKGSKPHLWLIHISSRRAQCTRKKFITSIETLTIQINELPYTKWT